MPAVVEAVHRERAVRRRSEVEVPVHALRDAGLLNLAQRRDGFIHNLLHRHKLDVVTQHNIQMIRSQPV